MGIWGRGTTDGQTAARDAKRATTAAVKSVRAGKTNRGASPIRATKAAPTRQPRS